MWSGAESDNMASLSSSGSGDMLRDKKSQGESDNQTLQWIYQNMVGLLETYLCLCTAGRNATSEWSQHASKVKQSSTSRMLEPKGRNGNHISEHCVLHTV